MNKPNSLKRYLLEQVRELQSNPDKLSVFIDQGTTRSTTASGLSFEYAYSLNLLLCDFAGHPDHVMGPLIQWLLINQPDILQNLSKGQTAISFEADILADDLVDLSITLPLTERVLVSQHAGQLHYSHPAEPQLDGIATIAGLNLGPYE